MEKNEKTPVNPRIDLSACKLLSTYGRDIANVTSEQVKVGTISKIGYITKTD